MFIGGRLGDGARRVAQDSEAVGGHVTQTPCGSVIPCRYSTGEIPKSDTVIRQRIQSGSRAIFLEFAGKGTYIEVLYAIYVGKYTTQRPKYTPIISGPVIRPFTHNF